MSRIESLIRRDPARRGLLGSDGGDLGRGELAAAATNLADRGGEIAIVTGFAVPNQHGIDAETDGPPGAVILADVLNGLGMEVTLVTDETCRRAVAAAMTAAGLNTQSLAICPLHGANDWCHQFLTDHSSLTHLISIERVGPAHTLESLHSQHRAAAAPAKSFETLVPMSAHNRCHNMRGDTLDEFTAPLHVLFEKLPERIPDARSIGVGDGGNELGMGRFAWEILHPLVPGAHGPRMVCRIATDWTIISGTCNWGGFALAACVALLRGRPELIARWPSERHEELLTAMVTTGNAVDGVTREHVATVDGLPFVTYEQVCSAIIGECCATSSL